MVTLGETLSTAELAIAPVENTVTTTDGTETTVGTIAIPDDTAVIISAVMVGRRTDAADRAGFIRTVVAFREGGGSAAFEGTVDSSFSRKSTGSYDATMTVSGNNVLLRVTGSSSHTINWRSFHTTEEVS